MVLVSIILIIFSTLFLFFKFKRRFELGLKIPGPAFIPFIGNLQFATLKPEGVFVMVNELRNKYKGCFRLWLGPNLWIFLYSPEQTKEALNNSNLTRAADFQLLKPLIGNGLLISEGKKWSTRRKALNPAFSSSILENFLDSFSHQADILVKQLRIYEKIEISDRLFLCILDIICGLLVTEFLRRFKNKNKNRFFYIETSMGAEVNSQTDPLGIYAKAFHDASHLLFQRMVNPLYGYDFIYKRTKGYENLNLAIKVIHDLTDKVIKERREKIYQQNSTEKQQEKDIKDNECTEDIGMKKKSPLLNTLLGIKIDGKLLTDDEIKEEVNTFLFAGVDTTKSAMSFILYNLAKHKNVQDQLYDEIKTCLIEENDMKGTQITMNHLNRMHYLDAVIKESLRLHTTVPLTGRQTLKELQICDLQIPENSTVWINLYGLAHDPNLFENPYEFRPERFYGNDDQLSKIPPYSYLPFSGGLHICIGKRYSVLMIKIITIKILINYELSLMNPNEELQLISEMVLKSKNGINLILKLR